MSNGLDPDSGPRIRITLNIFGLPIFIPLGGGGQRRAIKEPIAARGLPALPLPSPLPPTAEPIPTGPRTPPFIPGPAANDPVFRAPALGKLLGIGGLVITVADVIVRVLEGVQLGQLGDILTRQDREIARINIEGLLEQARRAKELEVEKKVRKLLGAPETFETPLPVPPPAPAPEIIFAPIPGIVTPKTAPTPVPAPSPQAVPGPSPTESPVVRPLPSGTPEIVPAPGIAPGVFPLLIPEILPFPTPRKIPLTVGDRTLLPSPAPRLASQFQLGTIQVPSPQLALQLEPATCRARKCDDDLDRNRTECFKGLYRESLRSTDFTQWIEIDCITGREK